MLTYAYLHYREKLNTCVHVEIILSAPFKQTANTDKFSICNRLGLYVETN